METVKAIRKHSAQHDLFNRLHSINADASFVRKVAEEWYEGRFPVVPNLRCGSWYCDPSSSSSQYAYFKSTDGHTNNWSFNLRRSNLGLAKYAEEHGGIILVDSTRRGKRMPDALSKTVPIWCAVINLALEARLRKAHRTPGDWDTTLYLPPNIVSPSERAQIEALLAWWAESLESSNIPLPPLEKPLRPFFIHPSSSSPPQIPVDAAFTPIICVSASRWIGQASIDDIPSFTRLPSTVDEAARTVGFEYVQGAGDDHESWGRGLTPELFHQHKARLLRADKEDVPDVVDELVLVAATTKLSVHLNSSSARETALEAEEVGLVGFPDSSSRLALAIGPTTTFASPWQFSRGSGYETIWVVPVERHSRPAAKPLQRIDADNYIFRTPSARDAGKSFSEALHALVTHVIALDDIRAVLLRPGDQRHLEVAFNANTGAPRKAPRSKIELEQIPATAEHREAILPLTMALTLAVPMLAQRTSVGGGFGRTVSKGDIAKVLHELVALWPDGNPPRAALKRVNEYLMSGSHRPSA